MRRLSNVTLLYLAAVLVVISPRTAYAYLDPATGSMLLQLVLGGLAGLALMVKLFWRKILRFLGFERRAGDEREG